MSEGEKILGHSTPCGSSSGSAVAVAAGFAPLALGTESDGSVTQPAGRASLYAMKLTVGSINMQGTLPHSPITDSMGGLTKTAEDLAVLTAIITGRDQSEHLTGSWEGQRIAFVNPELWELSPVVCNRDEAILEKQVC